MFDYEIRVLGADRSSTRLYKTAQTDDFAAVRRAHAIAADGECLEVWQQMRCVYSDYSLVPELSPDAPW
jgi:hypothetical protein